MIYLYSERTLLRTFMNELKRRRLLHFNFMIEPKSFSLFRPIPFSRVALGDEKSIINV